MLLELLEPFPHLFFVRAGTEDNRTVAFFRKRLLNGKGVVDMVRYADIHN